MFLLTNIPDIDDPITWHSTWGRLQAIEARMSCRMNLTSQSAIINLSTSDMTSKPTMLPSVSHAIEPAQKRQQVPQHSQWNYHQQPFPAHMQT